MLAVVRNLAVALMHPSQSTLVLVLMGTVDSGDSAFKSLHCLRLVLDWFQQQRQRGKFLFTLKALTQVVLRFCLATAVVVGYVLGGERRDRRC